MSIVILIASLIIISILLIQYHNLKEHQNQVIEINRQRQEENKKIDEQNENLLRERDAIQENIQTQNLVLQSIIQTNEQAQKNAEELVKKACEARQKELEAKANEDFKLVAQGYQLKINNFERQLDVITTRRVVEEQKLKDIEQKQMAYIEAQKRKAEMDAKQDFYRLNIGENDKSDITALRDLQMHFYKKDSIDKLIWEIYYKPAYDALMGRLFGKKTKICGIYKITDITTGLAYIGQSVDIKERFRQHIKTSLTYGVATNKLYQTLQKSGQYNFTFEILEEVERSKLNERETYWINFYKTKEYGLNSTRGGS